MKKQCKHGRKPTNSIMYKRPSDITTALNLYGFVIISGHLPELSGLPAFSELGKVVKLPGVAEVQVLTPRHEATTSPNTYSGNFGIHAFPLHTDLAHWFLPPRYLALRCVVGVLRWTPSLRQPEGQIKRVSHPYARFHHA